MIGYRAKTKVLRKPRGKQSLQIVLHSSDNTLEGVTVTDTRRSVLVHYRTYEAKAFTTYAPLRACS